MDYEELLREFAAVADTNIVTATDDYSATPLVVAAARAGKRLRVQKIVMSVTTTAAQAQTLRTITNSIPVAALAASPAIGPHTWDFGTKGLLVPEDDGLEFHNAAAGVAMALHIQGYFEPIPSE